jgi:hypothetical protein
MNWSGRLKSCDFATKWTLRRMYTEIRKWSMNEKWLGATITGPSAGIFCESMQRVRNSSTRIGVSTSRTTSYMKSGSRVRVRV